MDYQSFKGLSIGVMLLISLFVNSCKTGESDIVQIPLFSLPGEEKTHIGFLNQVEYTEEYNTYTYRNL